MDEDYPRNLPEFDARFASEKACREAVAIKPTPYKGLIQHVKLAPDRKL